MKVIETEYGTSIDILFNLAPYNARPIMVDDTGVEADETTGKKIVKAGSILDKDGAIVNDGTARYVLLKDIDVTYGPAAGAGVYTGTLDEKKIEKNTGVTISDAAKVALRGIFFMSDDDLDYVGGTEVAAGTGISVAQTGSKVTVSTGA